MLPPDLEVLSELERDLNERERLLTEKADSLEWDRLGLQIAVDQLARDRAQWEQDLAARKLLLDSQQAELAEWDDNLRKRENALRIRKAKVESDARANRSESKRLGVQATQQASTERKLDTRENKVAAREVRVVAAETRHRARRTELAAAKNRIDELVEELGTANAERDRLQQELQEAGALTLSALHIPSWDVARWMLSEVEIDFDQFADKVAFTGDGPFERADLAASARQLGLQVGRCGAMQPARVLVVGREGWDQPAVEAHVGALEDDDLFIFPQELWVASLLIRYNPFLYLEEDDACRTAVETFGEGHPVIEWLRGMQFPWPNGHASDEPPPPDLERQVKASPLVKLGYRVGKTYGLPVSKRRNVLSEAFLIGELPLAEFEVGVRQSKQREYMESWGEPQSRIRLRRMAWHLAMLVSMHARLRNHEVAVQEWEADLAWLKKRYYSAFMRFQWP